MIDDFFAWLPGTDLIDWLFLIGTVVVVVFVGFVLVGGVGLLADWLRSRKPVRKSTPAPPSTPVAPEPAAKSRSPFARRRSVVVVGDSSDRTAEEIKAVAAK